MIMRMENIQVCKSCDFYTSIYSKKHDMGLGAEKLPKINLKKFLKLSQNI